VISSESCVSTDLGGSSK